ncbi:MAG: SIMPL domain-containing protein [Flavobacteriales bacterium]
MKITSLLFAGAMVLTTALRAQESNIYNLPRVVVNGEASKKVEADIIYGWLNIYDNNFNYDYTVPYDDKAFKKKQLEMVDKLGVKDMMVNPSYESLKAGTATSPFQLKFTSKTQFAAMQAKAAALGTEFYTVSLDFASVEISDEKRKTITDQLLDIAMVDAKSKAEKLAKGLGGVLGKPLYIEEIKDYYGGGGMYDYSGETTGMYNADMMVTITARVSVQFELK